MNLVQEYTKADSDLRLRMREARVDRDVGLLNEWRAERGAPLLYPHILPKLGVIVELDEEPCASAFAYMDNSKGICFLDHITTRPGLPLREAKTAMVEAVRFLIKRTGELNYNVLMFYAQPAIATMAEKHLGFAKMEENVVWMMYINKEVQG